MKQPRIAPSFRPSLIAFGLLTWMALPGSGQQIDIAGAQPRIDAVFAEFDSPESPGCVVGVHVGGELSFAKGYGMADLERGVPLTPTSVLRIGSTSKQITAAAMVLLEQDGLLSLDDPIHEYLPELQDFGPTVTIRHMLNMTSGLRDYLTLTSVAGYREHDYYTDADLVELLSRQRELNFEPNTEFLYSNSGYFLASQIVLRVSGQSLRDFAKERIFDPLGMTRTHYHDDHTEIVPDRALGYTRTRDGFALSMTTLPMTGDGGVFTSVTEWAQWNRNFDHPQVGGESFAGELQRQAVLNSGDTLDYAIGLRHGTHGGLPTVSHGGAFVGFRADHIRYPTEDVAVTAFCNLAQTNPSALVREVGEALLEDRMTEESASGDAGNRQTPELPRAPSVGEVERLAGSFYSPELDVVYRFTATDDGSFEARVGAVTWEVRSFPDGSYWVEGLRVRPYEASGRIDGFFLDAGRVVNLRFERIEATGR